MRRFTAFQVLLVLLATPPVAAQQRDQVRYYPLRLLDLTVRATKSGVALAAAPSVYARQGATATSYVAMLFHPDTVMAWLPHARAVLTRVAVTEPEERIQWTRSLRAYWSNGALAVGRTVKDGRLRGDRWLALGGGEHAWQLTLTEAEADSVLNLLLEAAYAAGIPDSSRPIRSASDTNIVAAEIIHQPRPEFRGVYGRVYVQYVIGEDGYAEPDSIMFLVLSDPRLEGPARSVILGSRFKPALKDGIPVRQLAQQGIVWNFR